MSYRDVAERAWEIPGSGVAMISKYPNDTVLLDNEW